MTHDEIAKLLQSSRAKNKQKLITGILIKNGPFFIQLLEGQKQNVMDLFRMISKDARHKKIRTLMTSEDQDRFFPQWQMGFSEGKENRLNIEGLVPLIHEDALKTETTKARIISVRENFNQL